MNIKHPTRSHSENKPMRVFLMRDVEQEPLGVCIRLN